jgi:hypothetical protein
MENGQRKKREENGKKIGKNRIKNEMLGWGDVPFPLKVFVVSVRVDRRTSKGWMDYFMCMLYP